MWTSGIPSPNVEKAMLTPSLVLAYWMRGSATVAPSHRVQSLRLANTLQLVLATVIKGYTCRCPCQAPHGVRYQHLTRL